MRKVEARMIQAIRELMGRADYDGTLLRCGNTTVEQSHHGIAHAPGYQRIISVRLHGNEIAAIRPIEGTVWVSDCGWQTVTTKSRLNALLGCLTRHGGISQRNGQWLQWGSATWTEPGKWEGSHVLPLALNADNWQLRQAERLAA